jgi:hypothetical protein
MNRFDRIDANAVMRGIVACDLVYAHQASPANRMSLEAD